jgi:hypothetical protein
MPGGPRCGWRPHKGPCDLRIVCDSLSTYAGENLLTNTQFRRSAGSLSCSQSGIRCNFCTFGDNLFNNRCGKPHCLYFFADRCNRKHSFHVQPGSFECAIPGTSKGTPHVVLSRLVRIVCLVLRACLTGRLVYANTTAAPLRRSTVRRA